MERKPNSYKLNCFIDNSSIFIQIIWNKTRLKAWIRVHREVLVESELERDRSWQLESVLFPPPADLKIKSWMCCLMRSMATVFSAPLGMITSAYFLVGIQNSSNAGLTREVYCSRTVSRSRPRSSMSLITRLVQIANKMLTNISIPTWRVWCPHRCRQRVWDWTNFWCPGSRKLRCPGKGWKVEDMREMPVG